MDVFADYLAHIADQQQRARMHDVLAWVTASFPQLTPTIAWKQPMFTDHGTFIIGFSVAKQHMAVARELVGITHFSQNILRAGFQRSKMLVRFPWDRPVDFSLLGKMIEFNLADKAHCVTFWRKFRNIVPAPAS
ncbi:iron chaperone [Massilia sp. TSP1-1-2]|uniref:iron chaperone n=1 Tax=unclassified Massilia TaxID=2609279 RepID=UPI003CF492D4